MQEGPNFIVINYVSIRFWGFDKTFFLFELLIEKNFFF